MNKIPEFLDVIRRLAALWCVIYAGEGRENEAEDFIRGLLPQHAYRRCFHLVRHMAYKNRGRVRDMARACFPGYVFIETDTPQLVQEALEPTSRNLLFSGKTHVTTLNEADEALFRLITDKNGKIGLSVARVSGEDSGGKKKVEFLSGPLKKVSDRVTHIDFHKRFARIDSATDGKGPLRLGFRFDTEEIWSDGQF